MENNVSDYFEGRLIRASRKKLIVWLNWLLLAAGLAILIFSFSQDDHKFKIFSLSVCLSIACGMSGVLLGLLFGIPRVNENHDSYKKSRYTLNSNLTDISDWLTKIIIGVGLVEIKQLYQFFRSISLAFEKHVSCGEDYYGTYSVFAFSCIIFFITYGIYFGYNYVRLFLSRLYVDADEDIFEREKIERANNSDAMSVDLTRKMIAGGTVSLKNLDLNVFDELIRISKSKLAQGLLLNPGDPQKGQWGGKSESRDYRLSAIVETTKSNKNLFRVRLKVESSNPAKSLSENDIVIFNLHQTFGEPHKAVFVINGVAELKLIAYGAFTVGVFIVPEKLELELDLAELKDAPKEFKER